MIDNRIEWIAVFLGLLIVAGCAVRLGGPEAVEYGTLAMDAPAGSSAEAVAERIRGADVVLLSAEADSAWFADVARHSQRTLSGPGRAGRIGLAFLAMAPLGDTTIALPVEGSSTDLVVHDALYQVDEERYLDLLAFRLEPSDDPDAVVRTLMTYIATDVSQQAAVVLAVDAEEGAPIEDVAERIRPALADARTCLPGDSEEAPAGSGAAGPASGAPPSMDMFLFYGPQLRIRCEGAELRTTNGNSLLARLVMAR